MSFRSHHATYALACIVLASAPCALAADPREPIALQGHALGGTIAEQAKPKASVTTEIPVSFEMRGRVRADGTVELTCSEASHGVLGPHEHGDGREEIR